MAVIDLANRFDDISIDFFNGDLELLETINALEDLSEECESCLKSRLDDLADDPYATVLSDLLADITDFEESLLDASSLSIEDSLDEDSENIDYVNDFYVNDFEDTFDDEESASLENTQADELETFIDSDEEQKAQFVLPTEEIEDEEDVNFATDKDYDKMRQQWVDKRTSERKASQKTEKETPLEERYKAAMTAFKDLQKDDSQAWKLEDEAQWLVDDLDRWTSEALEWRDIFTKYYNKLAKEIQKRADKIADKYDTPITEEDINIEEQIDNSDEVEEEEIQDIEEKIDESTNNQEAEQNAEEDSETAQENTENQSTESSKKETAVAENKENAMPAA